MINKYIEAWENYQRKADEEWDAYEREVKTKTSDEYELDTEMDRYWQEIWRKKYPFYVAADEEKRGVSLFFDFIKENFKKDSK